MADINCEITDRNIKEENAGSVYKGKWIEKLETLLGKHEIKSQVCFV